MSTPSRDDELRGIAVWHMTLDEAGRAVFFPHGVGARGHVVEDEARLRQLLRLALIHRFATPVAVMALILAPRSHAPAISFVTVLLAIALIELWYHTSCRRLLKDLPVSEARLSSKEIGKRRRRGQAPVADWLQLGSALALLVLGLSQAFLGDAEFSSFGWFIAVLAGLLAAITIRSMMRYRSQAAPR